MTKFDLSEILNLISCLMIVSLKAHEYIIMSRLAFCPLYPIFHALTLMGCSIMSSGVTDYTIPPAPTASWTTFFKRGCLLFLCRKALLHISQCSM